MRRFKKFLRYLQLFCFILFIYVGLDAIWILSFAKPIYVDGLEPLLRSPAEEIPFAPLFTILAYTLLILGIIFFVLPKGKKRYLTSFGWGLFYGAIIYGVYESTNYVVLTGWPLDVTIIDILWGMFVCGMSSLCGNRLYKSHF